MTEFIDIRKGQTLTYEPHDVDDRGLLIKPGQRLRISSENGQSLVLDRANLEAGLRFLDEQKETA